MNEFTRHTPSVATAISAGVNDSAMVVVGLIASLQRFAATDPAGGSGALPPPFHSGERELPAPEALGRRHHAKGRGAVPQLDGDRQGAGDVVTAVAEAAALHLVASEFVDPLHERGLGYLVDVLRAHRPRGRRKIVVPVSPTRPNCLMMFAAGAITTAACTSKPGHGSPARLAVGAFRTGAASGLPLAQRSRGSPRSSTSTAVPACSTACCAATAPAVSENSRDPGVGPQQHRRQPRDVARQGRRGDRLERVGRRQVRVARDRPHPLVRGRPVGREEGGEPVAIARRAAFDGSVDAFRRAADRRGVRYAPAARRRRRTGRSARPGSPG